MSLRPSAAVVPRHDDSLSRSSSLTFYGTSSSLRTAVFLHLHERASPFNDRKATHNPKLKVQHPIASPRWHVSATLPQGDHGGGVSRITCPSALDSAREPQSAAKTDLSTSEDWDCDKSAALYRIDGWSGGYFSVNKQGHVVACVDGDPEGEETSGMLQMAGLFLLVARELNAYASLHSTSACIGRNSILP